MAVLFGVAVAGALAYFGWRFFAGGMSVPATLLLSQSVAIIQNLLRVHGSVGEPVADPQGMASRLVARVVAQRPDVVSGSQGLRPHRLSLAAIALAAGLEEREYDEAAKLLIFLALGTVLLELTGKPHQHALSLIDHKLITASQSVYLTYDETRDWLAIAS